jgi:hypothetical protein
MAYGILMMSVLYIRKRVLHFTFGLLYHAKVSHAVSDWQQSCYTNVTHSVRQEAAVLQKCLTVSDRKQQCYKSVTLGLRRAAVVLQKCHTHSHCLSGGGEAAAAKGGGGSDVREAGGGGGGG